MITLIQITHDDNWNGTCDDPNQPGVVVANRESTMDLEEHRRIVLDAKSLFAGNAAFPGTPGVAWESLRQLRTVFTTTSNRTVRISKGIHQPGVDPHIQLSMTVDIDGHPRLVQFHLNLTTQELGYDKLGDMRFTWRAVQFTAVSGNVLAAWPAAVARKVKETNIRRLSITPSAWTGVKDAMEQAKAAAEAKKKVQDGKDDVTAFVTLWGPFKKLHFATFKAFKTKHGDIQNQLLASGTFTEGAKTITYNRKSRTLAMGTA